MGPPTGGFEEAESEAAKGLARRPSPTKFGYLGSCLLMLGRVGPETLA